VNLKVCYIIFQITTGNFHEHAPGCKRTDPALLLVISTRLRKFELKPVPAGPSPTFSSLQPVKRPTEYKLFVLFLALTGLAACTAPENQEVKIPPLPDNVSAIQEASLLALSDAIEDEPSRSEYYYRRALLYQQAGKKQMALQDLTQAIDNRETNERYGRYYALRAQLLMEGGLIDSAFRDAEQALKLEEGQAPGFVALLGQLYAVRGDYKKANASLDEALRRTPAEPQLYYWKGHVAASTGDTARAVEYLHEAIRRRPVYREAYNRLTEISIGNHQMGRAKTYGLKGYSIDPAYLPLNLNLGKLYMLTGQNDSAKIFLREALRSNQDLPVTMHQLAGLYFGSEEYSLALPHYEKLLQYRSRWPEVPYRLYLCFDKTGRGRDALARYTGVIERDSTNMAALEVYGLLKKREEQKREWRALDSLARRRKQLFSIETIPLEIKE
jgi:tetratricopeptide (TPR) repeat protein